jgi:hypothetical protein
MACPHAIDTINLMKSHPSQKNTIQVKNGLNLRVPMELWKKPFLKYIYIS